MKTKYLTLALFSCVALGLAACVPSSSHAPQAVKHEQALPHNDQALPHNDQARARAAEAHINFGHNHEHAYAHSCTLTMPLGFAEVFTRADLTLIGTASDVELIAGETYRVAIDAERILKGSSSGTLYVEIQQAHGDVEIPSGERVLLALRDIGEGRMRLAAPSNSTVLLDRPECAGAESYVKTLFENHDITSVTPLIDALVSGGQVTRFRAALDYRLAQESAMTANDFARVAGLFDHVEAFDPSLPEVMQILATSKNPAYAETLVSLIETPAAMRVFEDLDRLLDLPGIVDGALAAIEPRLAAGNSPIVRRLAAYLLARSKAEGAQDRCLALLEDADLDVASEAIIGLAGSQDAALRSRIRDEVQKRMSDTAVEHTDTELGKTIRNRQLYAARHGWHEGENLRLMAAIYFVARSPQDSERNWLLGHLNFIEDFGIRTFAEAKARGLWQSYDSPW